MKKISVWMLALMLVPGLMLVGCKKDEEVEDTPATTEMETTMEPTTTDMGTTMSTDMGTDLSTGSTDLATTTPPAQ
jgi:hypothetical protein